MTYCYPGNSLSNKFVPNLNLTEENPPPRGVDPRRSSQMHTNLEAFTNETYLSNNFCDNEESPQHLIPSLTFHNHLTGNKILKSVKNPTLALVLQNFAYWFTMSKNNTPRLSCMKDGRLWLVKQQKEWMEEFSISKSQLAKVIQYLKDVGLIEHFVSFSNFHNGQRATFVSLNVPVYLRLIERGGINKPIFLATKVPPVTRISRVKKVSKNSLKKNNDLRSFRVSLKFTASFRKLRSWIFESIVSGLSSITNNTSKYYTHTVRVHEKFLEIKNRVIKLIFNQNTYTLQNDLTTLIEPPQATARETAGATQETAPVVKDLQKTLQNVEKTVIGVKKSSPEEQEVKKQEIRDYLIKFNPDYFYTKVEEERALGKLINQFDIQTIKSKINTLVKLHNSETYYRGISISASKLYSQWDSLNDRVIPIKRGQSMIVTNQVVEGWDK